MSDPTPNTQQPTPIEARGLKKAFGKIEAVDDVSLSIPCGEIFGLVGPDGAGKTTVFRLLLGLLQPDAGTARLGGFDPKQQPQEARSLVGYVAQQFTLYGDLSVKENLEFVSDVRGLSRREYRERSQFLLDLTALAPFTQRLARDLSGGMKRKLALACALLHRPQILLLDEPTTGVDPVSRREFWRMLYGLPAEGVTLLVSTPYLDEAARCGRLGFMAAGRLLAVDTPEDLRRRMPDALVEIDTPERTRARRLLQARPEVRRVETVGGKLRVAYDPAAEGSTVARTLSNEGIPVTASQPVEATLEDVFSALSDRTGAGA